MRRELKVEKLSDEFGQYELVLTCAGCGHQRIAVPNTFANLCGWEAKLADVVKRLRCSKCNARQCTARVSALSPPRKYYSH